MKRSFKAPAAGWANSTDFNYANEEVAVQKNSDWIWVLLIAAVMLFGFVHFYNEEQSKQRADQQADADVIYYSKTDPAKAMSIRCANARTPEERTMYCSVRLR